MSTNNFAILNNKNFEINDNNTKSQLIQKGFGTKLENNKFILDLFETNYLFLKNKIKLKDKTGKKLSLKAFEKICEEKINNFENKYKVYSNFRDEGYIVKDGTMFGFDFRVYERSEKNPKEHTHTKFVVDVKRSHKDEMAKIIRAERLANTLHTIYIIAIIDQEDKITKIKLERFP